MISIVPAFKFTDSFLCPLCIALKPTNKRFLFFLLRFVWVIILFSLKFTLGYYLYFLFACWYFPFPCGDTLFFIVLSLFIIAYWYIVLRVALQFLSDNSSMSATHTSVDTYWLTFFHSSSNFPSSLYDKWLSIKVLYLFVLISVSDITAEGKAGGYCLLISR